jgi:hypothetical protein
MAIGGASGKSRRARSLSARQLASITAAVESEEISLGTLGSGDSTGEAPVIGAGHSGRRTGRAYRFGAGVGRGPLRGTRRGRVLSGSVVGTAVGALVAGVVFAVAPNAATAALHQVSAWLTDDRTGSVVQVDGLTGKADAKVTISTDTSGHRLKITQSGSTVLIEDLTTGRISSVDPSQLSISASATLSTAGTRIVVGGGVAYLVNPSAGTAQRLDPVSLALIGPPVGAPALRAPLGDAQIGSDGTLWVADDASGQLIPVRDGQPGRALKVGAPGDALLVSVAGGHPVVTDTTSAILAVPPSAPDGTVRTISLPPAVSRGQSVLEPPSTSGSTVPVVVTPANQLVLVNTAQGGSADTVTLTAASGDTVDAPLILGTKVYLPDETRGALLVYDTAAHREIDPIAIGSGPGSIDAFVQDGEVWANTPGGVSAVCIGSDGSVHRIDKEPGNLPGGSQPSSAPPRPSSAPPVAAGPPQNPHTSAPVVGGGNPNPVTHTTAPPTGPGPSSAPPQPPPSPSPTKSTPPPAPTAPASVTERAMSGYILVVFNPVATGVPLNYQLTGAPSGATVSPSGGIPASGSAYQFQVSGLSCGQTYTFGVSAVFSNGSASTQASSGAQPCQTPGQVSGLSTSKSSHQISVNWSAAAANGGTVTYQVSWSGGASGSATVTGTSHTISNLPNDNTYDVTVTPSNGAGTGQAASASVDLSNSHSYTLYNAPALHLNLRAGPGTSYQSLGTFPLTPPGGPGASVAVLCQSQGEVATDPADKSLTGDIWDKVNALGTTGYVSDLYVQTPESVAGNYNSFSSNLWQC